MHGRIERPIRLVRRRQLLGRVRAHKPAPFAGGFLTGADILVQFFHGVAHLVESFDEDFDLSRTGGVDKHGADGDRFARVSV